MSYEVITPANFGVWLSAQSVTRTIRLVQLHHTAAPDYAAWNKKPDALYWQNAMYNYHVNTNGWADIAQQFTICPTGEIVTGRSLNTNPAGITGANSGAICIECIGNFDSDTMTSAQREAIITCVGELLKRFNLAPASGVTYHAWWTASGTSLGTYIAGRSGKTCPGTGFFGGNTSEAYRANLMPLLVNYIAGGEDLTMTQYEELKTAVEAVSAENAQLKTAIEAVSVENSQLKERLATLEQPEMIYNYIDDNMPEWAKEGVKWCADNSIIQGTGEGLGLSDVKLWVCVVLYRAAKILARFCGVNIAG